MGKRTGLLVVCVALLVTGVTNASLVCYYPFDGDPNDRSANNYPAGDGQLAGDTHYVDGRHGQALDFDGLQDFVQIMVAPDGKGGWTPVKTGYRPRVTIAMWVRMEAFPKRPAIDFLASRTWAAGDLNFEIHEYFGASMNMPFLVVQHGYFETEYPRNTIDPSLLADPNDNDPNELLTGWIHLAVTYDTIAQESYMYINGVPGNNYPITSGAMPNIGNYTLGGNAGMNARWFDGQIDELYIFDQTLNQQEILDLMDGKMPEMVCGDNGYFQSDLNTDCYVNFEDFAMMALEWLQCTDPAVTGCQEAP
jgi:hypothetical protein